MDPGQGCTKSQIGEREPSSSIIKRTKQEQLRKWKAALEAAATGQGERSTSVQYRANQDLLRRPEEKVQGQSLSSNVVQSSSTAFRDSHTPQDAIPLTIEYERSLKERDYDRPAIEATQQAPQHGLQQNTQKGKQIGRDVIREAEDREQQQRLSNPPHRSYREFHDNYNRRDEAEQEQQAISEGIEMTSGMRVQPVPRGPPISRGPPNPRSTLSNVSSSPRSYEREPSPSPPGSVAFSLIGEPRTSSTDDSDQPNASPSEAWSIEVRRGQPPSTESLEGDGGAKPKAPPTKSAKSVESAEASDRPGPSSGRPKGRPEDIRGQRRRIRSRRGDSKTDNRKSAGARKDARKDSRAKDKDDKRGGVEKKMIR